MTSRLSLSAVRAKQSTERKEKVVALIKAVCTWHERGDARTSLGGFTAGTVLIKVDHF